MDITGIEAIISALAGAAVAIITAYGTIQAKGIVLFPQEKIDSGKASIAACKLKIAALEGNTAAQEVLDAIGISSDKLLEIVSVGGEYAQNGYTVAEAQALGMMVVNAVKGE